MNKKVDLKRRNKLLKASKGLLGVIALTLFSGLIGIFPENKLKPQKKVVVKKVEATWG